MAPQLPGGPPCAWAPRSPQCPEDCCGTTSSAKLPCYMPRSCLLTAGPGRPSRRGVHRDTRAQRIRSRPSIVLPAQLHDAHGPQSRLPANPQAPAVRPLAAGRLAVRRLRPAGIEHGPADPAHPPVAAAMVAMLPPSGSQDRPAAQHGAHALLGPLRLKSGQPEQTLSMTATGSAGVKSFACKEVPIDAPVFRLWQAGRHICQT